MDDIKIEVEEGECGTVRTVKIGGVHLSLLLTSGGYVSISVHDAGEKTDVKMFTKGEKVRKSKRVYEDFEVTTMKVVE